MKKNEENGNFPCFLLFFSTMEEKMIKKNDKKKEKNEKK